MSIVMSKEVLLQNSNDYKSNRVLHQSGDKVIAEEQDGSVVVFENSTLEEVVSIHLNQLLLEWEVVEKFTNNL